MQYIYGKRDVDCTTKIRILKQITTGDISEYYKEGCRLHHKDTNFKANHNTNGSTSRAFMDVDCTTKIRILKQITTEKEHLDNPFEMSIAPQRYEF